MSTTETSVGLEKNLNGVIKIDSTQIHSHLDSMVRSTVEETLNKLLDEEADRLSSSVCREIRNITANPILRCSLKS